jgi:hypothetical protein
MEERILNLGTADELSASGPGRFTPGAQWMEDRESLRDDLEALPKKKCSAPTGNRTSIRILLTYYLEIYLQFVSK